MMLRRSLLVAPALAFATPAAAQLQVPTRWVGVRADQNAFIVEMPGVPDHKVLNDVSARGTAFTLDSYSIDSGLLSYVAQTALFPVDVDIWQPRLVLQAALAERAQRLEGGKWSSIAWREIDAAAAVESFGPLSTGREMRQLMLLKERRYVALAVLGPGEAVRGADAERFLKSLKIK